MIYRQLAISTHCRNGGWLSINFLSSHILGLTIMYTVYASQKSPTLPVTQSLHVLLTIGGSCFSSMYYMYVFRSSWFLLVSAIELPMPVVHIVRYFQRPCMGSWRGWLSLWWSWLLQGAAARACSIGLDDFLTEMLTQWKLPTFCSILGLDLHANGFHTFYGQSFHIFLTWNCTYMHVCMVFLVYCILLLPWFAWSWAGGPKCLLNAICLVFGKIHSVLMCGIPHKSTGHTAW